MQVKHEPSIFHLLNLCAGQAWEALRNLGSVFPLKLRDMNQVWKYCFRGKISSNLCAYTVIVRLAVCRC